MGLTIVSLVAVVLSGCESDYFGESILPKKKPKLVSVEIEEVFSENVIISIKVNTRLDEHDLKIEVREAPEVEIISWVVDNTNYACEIKKLEWDTDYIVDIAICDDKGKEVDRREVSFKTDIGDVSKGKTFIIPGTKITFVATDSEESVYASGTFGGGKRDKNSFVAKMDNLGALLWRNNIATPGYDYGATINPLLVDEEKNCLYFLNHQDSPSTLAKENFFINSYRLDNGELNWSKGYQGTFSHAIFDFDKNIIVGLSDRGIYKINSQGDVIDSYTGEHREGVVCFYKGEGDNIDKMLLVNVKDIQNSELYYDKIITAITYEGFFKTKLFETVIKDNYEKGSLRMTSAIKLEGLDNFITQTVSRYEGQGIYEDYIVYDNLNISGMIHEDVPSYIHLGSPISHYVRKEKAEEIVIGGYYYIETEDHYLVLHETFPTRPDWLSKKIGVSSILFKIETAGRIAPTEWGGYMSVEQGEDFVKKVYLPDWAWLEQFD